MPLRYRVIALLAFISVLLALVITLPEVLYDNFIWKYFWGPIVADAEGVYLAEHNGVIAHAGYNTVNTATYALLTIAVLYVAYDSMKGKTSEHDIEKFFFALFPLIIYGSVARVLEDAGLFLSLPLQAMFISPLIYIQMFALFLLVVFSSRMLEKGRHFFLPSAIAIVSSSLCVFLLSSSLSATASTAYLAISSLVFIFLSSRLRGWEKQSFLFSLFLLSLSIYFTVNIALQPGMNTRPLIILESLSLPAVLSVILLSFRMFREPFNSLAVFSQMLDATATYIGISSFNYYEKHVLPSFLMDASGPWIMIPIKFVIAVLIVYAVRDEEKWIRDVLLMLVIILGLAPGTRDMLRIALGV